jgi:hypothetical protein
MKLVVLIVVAIGIQAYALPKVILEGENGITGTSLTFSPCLIVS